MLYSQPKLRGMMMVYANIGYALAMILVATSNIHMPWRTVGLVCMFVPIFTAIAVCFVSYFK